MIIKIYNFVCIRERCFFILSQVWDKEKSLSPHEELNLRPLDSVLRYSTTESQRLRGGGGLLQSSYDMCPAYC